MYECSKQLLNPTHEHACAAHGTTISHMKNIVEILNYGIKEISSTNQDMQNYIDSCHNEPEGRVAYPE